MTHLEEDSEQALLDLLDGWIPPAVCDRELDGPFFEVTGGTVPVVVQFGRSPAGRLICTGLLVGWDGSGREVTARTVHGLRLGALLADFGSHARGSAVAGELVDASIVSQQARPARSGWPDSHFEAVAAAYRQALVVAPHAPIVWLTDQLHASRPTVQRWLQRCRDKGLLERSARRGPPEH